MSLGNNAICTNFILYKSGMWKTGFELEVLSKFEHTEAPFKSLIITENYYGLLRIQTQ